MIFNKGAQTIQWRKDGVLNKWCWDAGNGPQSLYRRMKDDSKRCCEREEKARGSTLRDEDPLPFFAPAFIGPSG